MRWVGTGKRARDAARDVARDAAPRVRDSCRVPVRIASREFLRTPTILLIDWNY